MSTLNEHDIDRIQDYIDGELPEDEMREVADRLNRDADWRAEEERLRALLRRVQGLPKSMEPSRDLWQGIERRIEDIPAENVFVFRRSAVYAVAAAAAVVVIGSVTFAVMNGSAVAPGNMASPSEPGNSVLPGEFGTPNVEFASWEDNAGYDIALAEYKSDTEALRITIQERRDSMEEETWNAVSESLAVIANAIQDIEAALEEDPSNQELRTMLVAAYQKEVGLLRQAVLL